MREIHHRDKSGAQQTQAGFDQADGNKKGSIMIIEILCIIEKNTATEQVHKKLLDESLEAIHERDGQFYKGTLRGRQVLESEQSIVIIGDVEEGATVASKGNVIVTGTIYGTVIAGAAGRTDAVIAALHMQPKKLRIGGIKVKTVIGGSYSWAKLL